MIQVNAADGEIGDTARMNVSFHTAAIAGDEIFQAYP
jgi:hypothetical protein